MYGLIRKTETAEHERRFRLKYMKISFSHHSFTNDRKKTIETGN